MLVFPNIFMTFDGVLDQVDYPLTNHLSLKH